MKRCSVRCARDDNQALYFQRHVNLPLLLLLLLITSSSFITVHARTDIQSKIDRSQLTRRTLRHTLIHRLNGFLPWFNIIVIILVILHLHFIPKFLQFINLNAAAAVLVKPIQKRNELVRKQPNAVVTQPSADFAAVQRPTPVCVKRLRIQCWG